MLVAAPSWVFSGNREKDPEGRRTAAHQPQVPAGCRSVLSLAGPWLMTVKAGLGESMREILKNNERTCVC